MKNLKNLGEILNKTAQKAIQGGTGNCNQIAAIKRCQNHCCPTGYCCGIDPYNCVLAGPNGRNCK